ncbi:amidohydrolase family protein [Actinoplanes friuliensis]|uniref:Amidohydrolase-family protein n=1 Tax=Actinoplanes friuliensis DSM 7358 TaxID=1246995 RepID=U5VTQ4_9ACTN|nr:amidohydrolase family protein [Actinoplanes friuliensis]AGZ39070.1 amidohydrolase-family protein [Actinoplanes friuliensis DSM 7358]
MDRLTNVTVVDPRDGTTTAHQDIHFADGRITKIGTTAGPHPDAIDGQDRFVVPGFVDMHAHPLNLADPAPELGLMLAFGITGFRQMSGTPDLLRHRPDTTDRTPALLATPGPVLTPINAGKPATAVAEVQRQARAGADFIKAALITPDVYYAVQAEADRLGIPVVGHLPAGIDVRAASRAGFRSIEHVGPQLGVLAGCSCHEDHLRAASSGNPIPAPPFKIPFADRIAGKLLQRIVINPSQLTTPATLAAVRETIDTFDEDKARTLARQFADNDTWNCPTLIRIKAQQLCDNPTFAADPNLRYATTKERKAWTRAAESFHQKFTEAQRATFTEQFDLQKRMVKILAEEGAPLLAGTDAVGAAWVIAGASLHDEFDLLAESGLTPLRILQTATTDPARFLNREKTAGTVSAGKEANLVLLDADPTTKAANLHTISAVIRAGTHHNKEALQSLKAQATNR